MSFRSRALLTGVATGFLKATNDRRDKMAERMQLLADNKALMDRERAKSRADAASKAAAEEASKWSELRGVEHIDDDGNYTDKYHDTVAASKFAEEGIRKAYGNDFEKFKAEWRKMGPSKFVRQYKDPNEIESSLQKVYGSIEARQQAELSRPVLTGFDAMLGSMVNRVSSAVGGKPVFGSDPEATPEVAELETMTGAQPSPMGEYEAPKFAPVVEQEKPETINQFIKGKDGKMYAVFADNTGKLMETELNIRVPEEAEGSSKGFGEMGTTRVRIFNPETNEYFKEETHQDIYSGTVRVGSDWVSIPEGMVAVPADIKIDPIKFPDPTTGEVMTVQAYRNVTGGVGKNDITMEDGTSWTPITKPVPFTDAQGNRVATKKIPPVIKTNLDDFNRQHKTVTLIDEMLRANYQSNPVSWAQKNLSILTDTIAASVGYQGNDAKDLEAMTAYVNKELDRLDLSEEVGSFDAEAVRAGETKAIQALLTFAVADSQKSGDRLSNQDVENARKVVEPWITNSSAHRGSLLAVRGLSEKRIATVVGQDISLALGQGSDSEVWDYYRSTKVQVDKGNTPVAEEFEGKRLIDKIKGLEETNPEAYAQTIKFISAKSGLGPDWENVLKRPVRVDTETGTTFLPFYREGKDGVIRAGIYKAK